jgi:hypothetical protein
VPHLFCYSISVGFPRHCDKYGEDDFSGQAEPGLGTGHGFDGYRLCQVVDSVSEIRIKVLLS